MDGVLGFLLIIILGIGAAELLKRLLGAIPRR
jgi:hypothetical protein